MIYHKNREYLNNNKSHENFITLNIKKQSHKNYKDKNGN